MKTTIDEVAADGDQLAFKVLTVDASSRADSPVLVYLHGKGQASKYVDEVPLVCTHLSPPFQAILGRLRNVTVVAPQAPHSPEDGWTWAPYLHALDRFLTNRFDGRRVLGSGFSRGGLGILQLVRHAPRLLTKCAILDPQRAPDGQETELLPLAELRANFWLRYGNAIPKNTAFASALATRVDPLNSAYLPTIGHGELALKGYQGDRLDGALNLYAFLELEYDSIPMQTSTGAAQLGVAAAGAAPRS